MGVQGAEEKKYNGGVDGHNGARLEDAEKRENHGSPHVHHGALLHVMSGQSCEHERKSKMQPCFHIIPLPLVRLRGGNRMAELSGYGIGGWGVDGGGRMGMQGGAKNIEDGWARRGGGSRGSRAVNMTAFLLMSIKLRYFAHPLTSGLCSTAMQHQIANHIANDYCHIK